MIYVALKNAISVRLEENLRLRLERIRAQTGLKVSHLIRQAVLNFVDRAEKFGIHYEISSSGDPDCVCE